MTDGLLPHGSLNCPGCNAGMNALVEPDMTTDVCGACGGMWLDRGELNLVVTSLGGDVEWAGQRDLAQGTDSTRACPRDGSTLKRASLLQFTGVEYELCPDCHGMYFDKNEIADANRALAKDREGSPELRQTIDGHLVRLDREHEASWGLPGYANVLAVYFQKPLDLDLHITQLGWVDRILGLVRRGSEVVQTGNPAFDSKWRVRSSRPDAVRRILSVHVQNALLGLADNPPLLRFAGGTIEIGELGISYREAPQALDKLDIRKPVAGSPEVSDGDAESQIATVFSQEHVDRSIRVLLQTAKVIEEAAR